MIVDRNEPCSVVGDRSIVSGDMTTRTTNFDPWPMALVLVISDDAPSQEG